MAIANDCDDCGLNRRGGIQVVEKSRIVNVSPSLLADIAVCQTKGYTRHVKGYTSIGDAIKATAGSAFHAAIAEHLRTDRSFSGSYANTMKVFHDVYDAPYERLSAELLEPSLTPKNLERILDRWIAMHPPSLLPWKKVLTVEEAFVSREWQLVNYDGPGRDVIVQLICRPDLIVEDCDGFIRWVDTKTTGWHIGDAGWRKQLKLSLQIQLYSDAVVQRYGEKARYGGWINAIELRKLPGEIDAPLKLKKDGTPAKPRTCAEHGMPYAQCGSEHAKAEFIECLTTPQRVSRALIDAQGYAADFVRLLSETDIERVDMRGTAKGECRFCPASDWCLADRPVEALDGFMKYERWVVDTGSR